MRVLLRFVCQFSSLSITYGHCVHTTFRKTSKSYCYFIPFAKGCLELSRAGVKTCHARNQRQTCGCQAPSSLQLIPGEENGCGSRKSYVKSPHLRMDIFHFSTFHIVEEIGKQEKTDLSSCMAKQSEELPGTTVVDQVGCIVQFRLHRYQPNLGINITWARVNQN